MIVDMKKLTFLVTQNEYEGFIGGLREQGVVHVQQLQQGQTSPELQQALDLKLRYQQALDYLKSKDVASQDTQKDHPQVTSPLEGTGEASPSEASGETSEQLLETVFRLRDEETSILHRIDEAEKNIAKLEPWGNFDWGCLGQLQAQSGLQVFFYACGTKSFQKEWAEKYFATPIDEYRKRTYFLAFSPDEPDIKAERLELPESSLSHYQQELSDAKAALRKNRAQVSQIAGSSRKDLLTAGLRQATSEIQLQQVHLSDETIADGAIRLMLGWVTADKAEALTQWLDQQHIFYELEDPAFEDDVPVKIVNGSFSSLFEPILRMYSLPSYHDIDPSIFFAPFFMLFFGLCLGDGGYGLLVLLGGIWLALRGKGEMKQYGRLGIWLGLATTVCGLLTGTVFGIDLTKQNWAVLAPVKPYFISDGGIGPIAGYSPMMVFSVIIGFVQVLLGMILKGCKAWKNYGFAYAIGTFSWVVFLLSAIALFSLPKIVDFPVAATYLQYGLLLFSAFGIFLYNNPSAYKNPVTGPLLNIGGGVWATYGMSTGLLGDLLSYIRLFALGLTGGVLGGVFNSLALDLTSSLPWFVRWLPMVLILLAGHGITFALSMISAFVHPMRLTFVEFFKNADFSGGGKEYMPFRR